MVKTTTNKQKKTRTDFFFPSSKVYGVLHGGKSGTSHLIRGSAVQ